MTDRWTPAKRSEVMSRIRSSGNANTELRLVQLMKSHGITGWRRHQELFGRPDFTFRRERVVVFVDGCFWHGCPNCYRAPTSNEGYWSQKVERNRSRDKRVTHHLRVLSWKVVRVWEHELRQAPTRVVGKLRRALNRPS
jgi:DNA mismatch endonuclease, patch repair protein